MAQQITNEMLYELLKEFKVDTNRQFDQVREELHDIKAEQREHRRRMDSIEKRIETTKIKVNQRLDCIESKIDNIHISWNNRLVAGVLGTSAVVSAFVAFFIGYIS